MKPLNLGEALHDELRQTGVDVTVHVPVLVNTSVIARIGLDKREAMFPEQAVDEALTARVEKRASSLPRASMSQTFEGMKDAVVDMIRARLAAAQSAH